MELEQTASPGQKLRQARLSKNLEMEDIAYQLHLTRQQIECIENDDYHYVSALAYARGHLRLYAKIVELPGQEILKAFDALGLKEKARETPLLKFHTSPTSSRARKRNYFWLIKWVGGIIVLLLLTFLWKEYHHHQSQRLAETAATTPATVPAVNNDAHVVPLALPAVSPPNATQWIQPKNKPTP